MWQLSGKAMLIEPINHRLIKLRWEQQQVQGLHNRTRTLKQISNGAGYFISNILTKENSVWCNHGSKIAEL